MKDGGGRTGIRGTPGLMEGVPGSVTGGRLGSEGVPGRNGGSSDGVGIVGMEGNGRVGNAGKFMRRRFPPASRPWIESTMITRDTRNLQEDMFTR